MRSTPDHDDGTTQDRCPDQNATAGSAASATTTLSNANAEATVHANRSRRDTTEDLDTAPTSSLAGRAGYDAELALVGAGPPLVYVPGMDGTGQLFYRQLPALARRFRVATYRLRDAATRMETLVGDLAAVLRAASPAGEPAVLVGESFGGTLALSFALAHPERVRALVILNSFPFFRPQHRLHLAVAGLAVMPWGAMRLVRRLTAFRLHSPHTHRAEIREFLRRTARTTKLGYVNRLRILTTYDLRERLRELCAPTLFLAADRDHLIPSVAQARLMAERVPDAAVRVLDGHGHSCFLAHDLDLDAILRETFPAVG
jgi:pimeloyl-ACP methyl ester carboxylesterase